jgi:UDPglucose 6-dehydrogenase
LGKKLGSPVTIVESVIKANQNQRVVMVQKIEKAVGSLEGKMIGVLGLAFKPNTSDVRESPAIDIIQALLQKGAKVKAYDPEGMDEFKRAVPSGNLTYEMDAYSVVQGVDSLIILTEWNEFRNLDLKEVKKLMARPLIVDLRNIYEPEKMSELGYQYVCVGRGVFPV